MWVLMLPSPWPMRPRIPQPRVLGSPAGVMGGDSPHGGGSGCGIRNPKLALQ